MLELFKGYFLSRIQSERTEQLGYAINHEYELFHRQPDVHRLL